MRIIIENLGRVCVQKRKNEWECRSIPKNMSNARLHWAVKSKWTNAWKTAVMEQVALQRTKLGKLPIPYAKVTITFYATHLMDYDGAYNAAKPLLDALKSKDGAGVIVDDSPKYIDLLVEQVKVRHKPEERVRIEVKN